MTQKQISREVWYFILSSQVSYQTFLSSHAKNLITSLSKTNEINLDLRPTLSDIHTTVYIDRYICIHSFTIQDLTNNATLCPFQFKLLPKWLVSTSSCYQNGAFLIPKSPSRCQASDACGALFHFFSGCQHVCKLSFPG